MKVPDIQELYAAPELALAPPLLATLEATLAALRAQHHTLHHEWLPDDPASLRAARVFADELARARAALLAYARIVRRTLRAPSPDLDDTLPF